MAELIRHEMSALTVSPPLEDLFLRHYNANGVEQANNDGDEAHS